MWDTIYQHLTPAMILAIINTLAVLWLVAKQVAKATPTTKDDELIARVEAGASELAAWGERTGSALWPVVEQLANQNLIPKVKKPAAFLLRLRQEWADQHPGTKLPAPAEAAALLQAESLSAADKLGGISIPLLPPAPPETAGGQRPDPLPAPGSH